MGNGRPLLLADHARVEARLAGLARQERLESLVGLEHRVPLVEERLEVIVLER